MATFEEDLLRDGAKHAQREYEQRHGHQLHSHADVVVVYALVVGVQRHAREIRKGRQQRLRYKCAYQPQRAFERMAAPCLQPLFEVLAEDVQPRGAQHYVADRQKHYARAALGYQLCDHPHHEQICRRKRRHRSKLPAAAFLFTAKSSVCDFDSSFHKYCLLISKCPELLTFSLYSSHLKMSRCFYIFVR